MSIITCRVKPLSPKQAALAIERAIEMNPANAMGHNMLLRTPVGRRGGKMKLTINVKHRWPTTGVRLSVQFLDNPPKDLRKRLLSHMNAWQKTANVSFKETKGVGQVRIARVESPESVAGYWSYVGDEILGIPDDEPTMNLQGFTMKTSEAEFRRVVRHETGHTLGFEHEHMRNELVKRIDPKKAYVFFDHTQGWTKQEVDQQVLTPLAAGSVMGTTEADPISIMCYQLPGEIMKDGVPIAGGKDINPRDFAFAKAMYPKKVHVKA